MNEKRENICIVGAGAIGLFLAAELSKVSNVWLLVREKQKASLMNAPIQVTGARAKMVQAGAINIIDSSEIFLLPNQISFWLCVKAYDLDQTLITLLSYLHNDTPVIIISNGLGIFIQAAQIVRRNAPLVRVLPSFGAYKESDTQVKISGDIIFSIAAPKDFLSATQYITALLSGIEAHVNYEKDVATAEWHKAMVNLTVNTLCSIADVPNGMLIEEPSLKTLASHVLAEVRQVALAEGFDLSNLSNEAIFEGIKKHSTNINSSLVDLRNGKKTEMEYIAGRFLRIAQHYNIPTPRLETLYALFRVKEGSSL